MQAKKKILIFAPFNLDLGRGSPLRALHSTKAIVKQHKNTYVVAYSIKPQDKKDMHFTSIKRSFSILPIKITQEAKQLKKQIEKIKPNVIYAHSHYGMFIAAVANRKSKSPLITDIHSLWGPMYVGGKSIFSKAKLYFFNIFESYFLKKVRGITTVSDPLTGYYKKSVPKRKTIPGGVDLSLFNPQVKPLNQGIKNRKNNIVVAYVGNFNHYQGVDILIHSAEKIVKNNIEYVFLFVGDYLKEKKKVKMLQAKKTKNFIFLGKQDYKKIPSYLASADILVIPRRSNLLTEYAFPSKLSEYLAMGKAVVATRVGPAKQLIKNNISGVLIEPNEKDLIKAILSLRKKSKREKLGKNAYKTIQKNYVWDVLAKKTLNFLDSF